MAPKLLQLKIDPGLKQDLDDIATYKGITVTSFVKLILKDVARKEKKNILTENGLTEEEELEILRREKEAIKAFKVGKLKVYKTSTALFKDLNA